MIRKFSLYIAILMTINNLSNATTYYIRMSTDVSPNHPGNNSNDGRSWAGPWADVTHLNDGTFHGGDTVFFGSGRWRIGAQWGIHIKSGNHSDMTVYACSTGLELNHASQIWNSDSLYGWTQYSGNIYQATTSISGTLYGLSEGDNSLLYPQPSLAAVNSAGKYYQSGSTIYAWTWSGGDPDQYDMEASGALWNVFIVDAAGGSYMKIYGLALQHSGGNLFNINESAVTKDSLLIEHCKLSHAGDYWDGSSGNANLALVIWNGERYASHNIVNSHVRACSLYECKAFNSSTGNINGGKGLEAYAIYHCLVDSNYFLGGFGEKSIWFKGHINADAEWMEGNAICYNVITTDHGGNPTFYLRGIEISYRCRDDSVYGNIIQATNGRIDDASLIIGCPNYTHNIYWLNNTFYDVMSGFVGAHADGVTDSNIVFKYNIVHRATNGTYGIRCDNDTWDNPGKLIADSNLYYNSSIRFNLVNGNNYTLSQWQALGLDIHSTIADPGFSNPAIGDFSRPNAGQEMYATYGGKTWTRYGAVQSTDPPPPPPALAISNVRATNITYNSATINWDTNIPASSQVEYGLTPSYGSSTTLDPSLVTAHAQTISGLAESTTYHYRVRSRDASNNEEVSGDYTFTTMVRDVTPPNISGVQATDATDNSVIIRWQTNESATSQVNYGLTTGYGQTTNLDNNLVLNHAVSISDLRANTLYHFRVRSSDASGNEAVSSDYTFNTDTTWSMANISINIANSVSGTYPGYSPTVINDGVINPRGSTSTTWASNQSDTAAHWVALTFNSPMTVRRARLLWALNNFNSTWMCSRQYMIQYWDNGVNAFVNAAVINNSSADSITTTDFSPVTTTVVRYWQPASMGPPNYPSIVWLTELEFYGSNAGQDTVAPGAIHDLNALPDDGHGLVRLNWTAPGDDGSIGQAAQYTIGYSQDPIDDISWANATLLGDFPFPATGGSAQDFSGGACLWESVTIRP